MRAQQRQGMASERQADALEIRDDVLGLRRSRELALRLMHRRIAQQVRLRLDTCNVPVSRAPVLAQARECAGLGERAQVAAIEARPGGNVLDGLERAHGARYG